MPPGPKGLPFIGSWIPYSRDPYEFLRGCVRKYGDTYRVPLPFFDLYMFNNLDDVSFFMDDTTGRFSMIGPGRWFTDRIGGSLPTLEGDRFRNRRKMLLPMFGRRQLARAGETLADEFVKRVDRWGRWADTGEFVDLQDAIAQVTLPGFMRTMFSSSITEEEIHHIDVSIRNAMRTVAAVVGSRSLPNLLPWSRRENFFVSGGRSVSTIRRIVRERRRNPLEKPDLLSVVLEATNEDGSPLSEVDVMAEIITMIGGGYETVVASLSWTLGCLLGNPEYLERLYAEVDALGGAMPTVEDQSRLGWAKACFDEGQRLQGAPINPRFVMDEGIEIGGYPIPKYSFAAVSLFTVQRDPRWWPEPDRYDPNRFMDPEQVKSRPRLAFMPFGTGPHHCIGVSLAYMQAQFLLSIIFQRYRLALPEGWKPVHNYTFSNTLKGGLPVQISRVAQ